MKRVILTALLALAACGRGGDDDAAQKAPVETAEQAPLTSFCDVPSTAEITQALGAEAAGVTDQLDNGSPHPGCSWMAELDSPEPRSLVFTVWRKGALEASQAPSSGRAFFDEALRALNSDYQRVGALQGVGDEAFMAIGNGSSLRFHGKIVAIKGDDVLTLQIDGKDPAAFEAIAKQIAEKM